MTCMCRMRMFYTVMGRDSIFEWLLLAIKVYLNSIRTLNIELKVLTYIV